MSSAAPADDAILFGDPYGVGADGGFMTGSMYGGRIVTGRDDSAVAGRGRRCLLVRTPILALAALLACSGSAPPPATVPAPASTPAPRRFVRLADASTLAILVTANNVDLAYARMAAARASSRDVKAFGRRMTQEHTSLNSALNILALRLDLTPREDEISRVMRDQGATRRDSLRALAGRHFDSAYVANEIRYHEELLVAIDRVFLPSARRPEIREFVVTSLRPAIGAHLAHAEQLRAALATPAPR